MKFIDLELGFSLVCQKIKEKFDELQGIIIDDEQVVASALTNINNQTESLDNRLDAVEDKILMGLATVATTGSYNDLSNKPSGNAKLFHGTCATAGGTVSKIVECSSFTSADLVKGALVFVTFTNTNSGAVASLTMNVNGTGTKSIKKYYSASVANLTSVGELRANETYLFGYDGTYWVCMTLDYNSNSTYTNWSLGQCRVRSTEEANVVARTCAASSYGLTTGGIVNVIFNNDVPASATLNINSKGAKPIMHRESSEHALVPIKAGDIKGGDSVTMMYNGSSYVVLANDRWGREIQELDQNLRKINLEKAMSLKLHRPHKSYLDCEMELDVYDYCNEEITNNALNDTNYTHVFCPNTFGNINFWNNENSYLMKSQCVVSHESISTIFNILGLKESDINYFDYERDVRYRFWRLVRRGKTSRSKTSIHRYTYYQYRKTFTEFKPYFDFIPYNTNYNVSIDNKLSMYNGSYLHLAFVDNIKTNTTHSNIKYMLLGCYDKEIYQDPDGDGVIREEPFITFIGKLPKAFKNKYIWAGHSEGYPENRKMSMPIGLSMRIDLSNIPGHEGEIIDGPMLKCRLIVLLNNGLEIKIVQ